ncbi:hypothetical protein ACIQF8_03140 [Pseudarthrobacter sp. NPDC092184]|uniref:hypothetical protein n=1 Tax=unclassified Pseudarthrobacter TaxID=2647000 RepID=UPI0038179987
MEMTCHFCGSTFAATRADARHCSTNCRVKAHTAKRGKAAELLRQQTRAIIDGADPAVLAAIARQAEVLLRD